MLPASAPKMSMTSCGDGTVTRAIIILVLAGLLAACSTTAGDFCFVSQPIRPSSSDSLTEGTARQVLAHNEYGARVCGWRP